MPRRNHRRAEQYEPLDLTPAELTRPSRNPFMEAKRRQERERQERLDRIERQKQARINRGIDWSVCLVPGCGEALTVHGNAEHRSPKWRDHKVLLPLCVDHLAVAAGQAEMLKKAPYSIQSIARIMDDRLLAKAKEVREQERLEFAARQDGDIYFVRVGSLVKVGWTRDLYSRLKSYGASAELLVSYPATRTDETDLHRQLRPALAKGREWYEDGEIIASFVAEALTRYGMPPTFDTLWTEPKRVVAGKRHR